MGTKQVSARWTGEDLQYVGEDDRGNEVPMGGNHPSPSQLMLMGAAGCMGMDIVNILRKKRQEITAVEVKITGHQPDDYPKPFEVVELDFTVKGNDVNPTAVERAIELSRDIYCIVGQTLKNEVELKTSFTVEEG